MKIWLIFLLIIILNSKNSIAATAGEGGGSVDFHMRSLRSRDHHDNLFIRDRDVGSYALRCMYDNNIKDMTWTKDRLSIITTRTIHPFLMTVLHNDIDRAVSLKLRDHGLWDPQVAGPLQFILTSRNTTNTSTRTNKNENENEHEKHANKAKEKYTEKTADTTTRICDENTLVIDIGANIGFISALSLSLGCNTVLFEPQSLPASAITATLCLNSHLYKQKGLMYQFIKSPVSVQSFVKFPESNFAHTHNTGGAGIADCMNSNSYNGGKSTIECRDVPAIHLDDYFYSYNGRGVGGGVGGVVGGGVGGVLTHELRKGRENIIKVETNSTSTIARTVPGTIIKVIKIDTEGYESDVIASMSKILQNQHVENILFEMIPHVVGINKNIAAIQTLYNYGYSIAECPFSFLEGVRQVDRPFIKKVIPLDIVQVKELLYTMNNEKDHQNWKKKHYTDLWAAKDATIFQRYNDITYAA